MLRRIHRRTLAWVLAPVLVMLLSVWLIGRVSNTNTLRLTAHYLAGEPPIPEPRGTSISDYNTRKAYERYLNEGTRAVFTETGLYLFEKGGSPVRPERGEAVIAKRDWAGRRQWAVTLPASDWRDIAASPDGQCLATVIFARGSTQVALWRDGKRAWAWAWTGDSPRPRGGFYVTNTGRVLIWFDPQLFVLEGGKIIASNPHLPLVDMTPSLLTRSTLVPDGSAMVSILHPRQPGDDEFVMYYWDKLPLEYRALVIRNHKIVPVRKFTVPNINEKNWQILAGGGIMLLDGTVYAPDGSRSNDEEPWYIHVINGTKEDNLSLWHGDAVVVQRRTPRGPAFRVYLPKTARTARLPVKLAPGKQLGDIRTSGDGDYVLTVTSSDEFPSTPAGRLVRWLAEKKLAPESFCRRFLESNRIELSDKSGKLCASLSGRYSPQGAACLTAAHHRYLPLRYALSPDGRRLVILAYRLDNKRNEYLHYTWK